MATQAKPMTSNLSQRLDFIESLELPAFPRGIRKEGLSEGKPSAFVVDGSLMSFVANISPQHQQDVLNSTLLAQLAANQKFNRETQTMEWYDFYHTVLENVGWVLQGFDFDKFNASGSTFSVDKVVLDIIAAIATGDEVAILDTTIKAMKSLSNDDNKIVLFETSSHSLTQGNFQLGIATDIGGVVALHLGAFHFHTTQNVTRVLFFGFSSSDTEFNKSVQTISLDQQIYNQVRAAIVQKLGDKAKRFVQQLDIG